MGDFLSLLLSLNLLIPHSGVVSRGYSSDHKGVDIICTSGDKIIAAHDGILTSYRDFRLGNVAVLRGAKITTLYAHLFSVSNAYMLKSGDVIGYCGNTGRWSTGPHLHFEVHYDRM